MEIFELDVSSRAITSVLALERLSVTSSSCGIPTVVLERAVLNIKFEYSVKFSLGTCLRAFVLLHELMNIIE